MADGAPLEPPGKPAIGRPPPHHHCGPGPGPGGKPARCGWAPALGDEGEGSSSELSTGVASSPAGAAGADAEPAEPVEAAADKASGGAAPTGLSDIAHARAVRAAKLCSEDMAAQVVDRFIKIRASRERHHRGHGDLSAHALADGAVPEPPGTSGPPGLPQMPEEKTVGREAQRRAGELLSERLVRSAETIAMATEAQGEDLVLAVLWTFLRASELKLRESEAMAPAAPPAELRLADAQRQRALQSLAACKRPSEFLTAALGLADLGDQAAAVQGSPCPSLPPSRDSSKDPPPARGDGAAPGAACPDAEVPGDAAAQEWEELAQLRVELERRMEEVRRKEQEAEDAKAALEKTHAEEMRALREELHSQYAKELDAAKADLIRKSSEVEMGLLREAAHFQAAAARREALVEEDARAKVAVAAEERRTLQDQLAKAQSAIKELKQRQEALCEEVEILKQPVVLPCSKKRIGPEMVIRHELAMSAYAKAESQQAGRTSMSEAAAPSPGMPPREGAQPRSPKVPPQPGPPQASSSWLSCCSSIERGVPQQR